MKAKINENIICIPPYVSTSWDHISFMQTEQNPEEELILVLHLDDGKCIKIRNLDKALIDLAFSAHLKYLESRGLDPETKPQNTPMGFLQNLLGATAEQIDSMPLKFGIAGIPGMENLEMAMQHNPKQADLPNLPSEVLEKVTSITKMITNGVTEAFPKPEPHCNCPHCQIARSIHGIEKKEMEEPVTDDDLKFRDWEIKPNGDKLYTVINPLDSTEQYTVFLGEPIGCTCGHSHCEHIKSVLLN